jgi:hypothetical protein
MLFPSLRSKALLIPTERSGRLSAMNTVLFSAVLVVHHRVPRAYHTLVIGDSGKDDWHEGFRFLFQRSGDTPHQ